MRVKRVTRKSDYDDILFYTQKQNKWSETEYNVVAEHAEKRENAHKSNWKCEAKKREKYENTVAELFFVIPLKNGICVYISFSHSLPFCMCACLTASKRWNVKRDSQNDSNKMRQYQSNPTVDMNGQETAAKMCVQ